MKEQEEKQLAERARIEEENDMRQREIHVQEREEAEAVRGTHMPFDAATYMNGKTHLAKLKEHMSERREKAMRAKEENRQARVKFELEYDEKFRYRMVLERQVEAGRREAGQKSSDDASELAQVPKDGSYDPDFDNEDKIGIENEVWLGRQEALSRMF